MAQLVASRFLWRFQLAVGQAQSHFKVQSREDLLPESLTQTFSRSGFMWQLVSSRVSHPRETMRKHLRSKLQTFCNLIMVIHIRCAVFYLLVACQGSQTPGQVKDKVEMEIIVERSSEWLLALSSFISPTDGFTHTCTHGMKCIPIII